MRILLVSDEAPDPGMGGPKVSWKLQAAFRALGHDCDVLFAPDLGLHPRERHLRIAVSPWLARRAIARAFRASGPYDVVDAAGAEAAALCPPLRPRWIGNAVVVARSHGLEHRYFEQLVADHRAGLLRKPWTRRLWYPLLRLRPIARALRRADRALLLNRADYAYAAARGWMSAAARVIPHGVDAARWAAAPPSAAPRGAGALFCGWWTSTKGVAYLAAAHALLVARGVTLPLTLFGVGEDEPFAALRARILTAFPPVCHPLLTMLPRLRDEDAVFAEYARHDLLVCSSTSDGFGLVVLEALSQRLPVVCTQAVGAAELLEHDRSALIVPPRDPARLADAIERLWRDSALRRRLGDAGHERVSTLTWEHSARAALQLYAGETAPPAV